MNTNTLKHRNSQKFREPRKPSNVQEQDNEGSYSTIRRQFVSSVLEKADIDELGAKLTKEMLISLAGAKDIEEIRPKRINHVAVNKKTAGVPGNWPLVGVYSIDTYDFATEPVNPRGNLSSSGEFVGAKTSFSLFG